MKHRITLGQTEVGTEKRVRVAITGEVGAGVVGTGSAGVVVVVGERVRRRSVRSGRSSVSGATESVAVVVGGRRPFLSS